MIFPLPAIWQPHDVEDPAARIDRHLADRGYRLSAGLDVSPDFSTIYTSLIVTLGHGKFVRVQHTCGGETTIPDAVAHACRNSCTHESNLADRAHALADLANYQAIAIEELKRMAGKYVDRILAVGVTDPGGWASDFDGRSSYWSMCDSTRLAELSGMNIVDAMPGRDVSNQGTGQPLEALPYWLLFADRSMKLATEFRAVISVGNLSRAFFLPPSDGLDTELPEIRCFQASGTDFLRGLARRLLPAGFEEKNLEPLNADGRKIDSLYDQWMMLIKKDASYTMPSRVRSDSGQPGSDLNHQLLATAERYVAKNPDSLSSVIHSAFVLIADQLSESISKEMQQLTAIEAEGTTARPIPRTPNQIWVSADRDIKAGIINQLSQKMPATRTIAFQSKQDQSNGADPSRLSAITAAMLGLMHVDQMPANVPWLTGSDGMRILGRLTPGKPSQWRQLIMEMADFRPPAMRLKDAI